MRTMQRVAPGLAMLLATASAVAVGAQQPARGRPLVIEDYYRLQTVGSPAISPSGRWVAFTVSTRIEDDNSTRTETFVVPADASARPLRVAHYGKDIASASWTADSRLEYAAERERWSLDPQNPSAPPHKAAAWPAGATASPDAKWIAFARDKSQSTAERAYASEFEKRHEERFKGVAFDWKDFQRDGAPFPAPNLRARPAAQLVVRPFDFARGKPAAGGAEKVLVDTDLRPAEIVWHPNGQLLAFTADAAWREELKYGNATRVDRDNRRHGRAGHRRRLCLWRPRLFAGRPLPVVRAQLRDGNDHPSEADTRRLARSVHPAGRRRRRDQPHRELGSGAGRCAVVARRAVHLLHG